MGNDAQCRDEEIREGLIGRAEDILVARDGVSIAEAERALRASARITKMSLSDVAMGLLVAHRHRGGGNGARASAPLPGADTVLEGGR